MFRVFLSRALSKGEEEEGDTSESCLDPEGQEGVPWSFV